MNVIDYVVEEVERQGYDTTALDGIERIGWMLNAWSYALHSQEYDPAWLPTLADAIELGRIIEPVKNEIGIRACNVRVGPNKCPDYTQLPRLLGLLFEQREALSAVEFYKEFELIHPFVDGNGRVGKVLYNMLNGTLLDPVFPPNNLFGSVIGNP